MLTVTEAIREQNPFPVKTVKPPTARDASLGPTDLPGTYVAVLAVEQAGIAQFARLGTFWFPRGFLLYVGSAFQKHVGVAGRAMRHLKSTGPRLWGLDYLRGFAKPAELWWTHHPDKLECAWARALAGMPEYCCPAPLAGASDCNSGKPPPVGEPELQQCPAHLFHAIDMPSVKAFAKQLGRSGSGGYEIRRREWSESRGWPDVESTGSSVENDWLDVSW